jgi:hypothetical protein
MGAGRLIKCCCACVKRQVGSCVGNKVLLCLCQATSGFVRRSPPARNPDPHRPLRLRCQHALHSNRSRTFSPAGRRRSPSGFAARPHRPSLPPPPSPPPASRYLLSRGPGSEEDEQWLTRCSSVPCAPTCSPIPPAPPAAAQRPQGRPQGQQVPSPAHRRKHLSVRSRNNPLFRGNEGKSFGLGCCTE